jgi:hypothetical protein
LKVPLTLHFKKTVFGCLNDRSWTARLEVLTSFLIVLLSHTFTLPGKVRGREVDVGRAEGKNRPSASITLGSETATAKGRVRES